MCQYNPERGKWEIVAKDFEKFASAISASDDLEVREQTALRRLANLNRSLYYVKGIKGDMIPTESVYAAFVKPLSEFAQHFNGIEFINTSLVGAQIDGFKNISLEEALQNSESVGTIDLSDNYTYNIEKIKTKLSESLNELKGALSIIKDGKKYAESLLKDLSHSGGVTQELLKSLKRLSLNYLSLSGDFADRSKIFDFITISDKIDLDYEMKMTGNFTLENISNITNKMKVFYDNAESRIYEIENIVNGVMDESFSAKS